MTEMDEDIAQLTKTQRRILTGYIKNGLSKHPKSNSKLAKYLGCDRKSLYRARKNPQWVKVYAMIIQKLTIADIGKVISHLMRNSKAGDTQASRVLLQFADVIQNTTKNLNLNIEPIRRHDNVEDLVDAMIIRLGELGISAEVLTRRYMELKNAGRF